MEWDSPHIHPQKDRDWFASLVIITGALAYVAILFSDYILMVLILAIAIAIIVHHAREHGPAIHTILNDKGILFGDTLYEWKNLKSFGVLGYRGINRLVCTPGTRLGTLLMIPLPPEVAPDDLYDVVSQYIPHSDTVEIPYGYLILERLGL